MCKLEPGYKPSGGAGCKWGQGGEKGLRPRAVTAVLINWRIGIIFIHAAALNNIYVMFQYDAKSNGAREILLTTRMTIPSIFLPLWRKGNRQQSPAIAREHAASAKARLSVVSEEQHHLGNVARGAATADGMGGAACCIVSKRGGEGG
jgi:hypothetical protein